MKKMAVLALMLISAASFANQGPKFTIKPHSQAGLTATTPGYCEIEVANHSSRQAVVDIYYDDTPGFRNNYVQPGYSLYVDLYYNGYCHNRAYLLVSSMDPYLLYAKYTSAHNVVDIFDSYNNKVAAKLQAK